MIIFLYNEEDQTLTLTSEDCTQYKIITRDNDSFDTILKLAQDPENDWSDIEPYLSLDYFNFKSEDVSIYIDNATLYYDFGNSKHTLVPNYLYPIIKKHRFEFNFADKMEAIAKFISFREPNKENVDAFMNSTTFHLCYNGKPVYRFSNGFFLIEAQDLAENGKLSGVRGVLYRNMTEEAVSDGVHFDFVNEGADLSQRFLDKCRNLISSFWKMPLEQFDEDRARKASKNKMIREKFKMAVTAEFVYFDDDILEKLTTYMYSPELFYEFLISVNPDLLK